MLKNEKNVYLFKHFCPLEVVFKSFLQRYGNVLKLMCNVQRKYNAILQRCGHIALQRCHFTLWQRCWQVFFTTLLNHPSYNVVQRCIYVVCLLGTP